VFVSTPTSRLLALLEILQNRGHATGTELAAELAVDRRTLRRYITALQELGVPIEGQRGVGGGYRVRPGYRLPPLMLGDDEVVAVVLGLLATRANLVPASEEAVEGALAKINRVLPSGLRRQVSALESTVEFSGRGAAQPAGAATTLTVAGAIWRKRRLRVVYTARDEKVSNRRLSPFALVVHRGRWYLAAHDHDRRALRTFRVDRIATAHIDDRLAAVEPPADFDATEYVQQSIASVPGAHRVSVVLDLPLDTAQERFPRTLGVLTETGAGTHLEIQTDSLEWCARLLAGIGCRFTIEEPDALRPVVTELANALAASA
jgi:predicted DNA-binding transcriptional regulator YafY